MRSRGCVAPACQQPQLWVRTGPTSSIAWSTLALAIGVLLAFVGVLSARQSVKESVKTRHAQIAMEMTQRWDTDISPVKRTVQRIEDVPFSVELR